MAAESIAPSTPPESKSLSGSVWLLALIPLFVLGLVLTLLVVTGGGLTELAGPPVEKALIQRITLPAPGVIQVEVVNDGPQTLTIPQVMVDDAFFAFTAEPSTTIPRLGRATFTIPYPWVEEETHVVTLLTSLGVTFTGEVAAAVETPQPDAHLFLQFGLVGLYVGVVPVGIGMLWYPFLRRLSRKAMMFILSLTVGLLAFLAIGTWLDAQEFAADMPVFWQGTPLVIFVALGTLGILLVISRSNRGRAEGPLGVAYQIALGIGIHNLGEGLAIGAAFALGQAALGTFLILGFTLHNITEGIGIVSPLVRQKPKLHHFFLLGLLAGGPAIVGTWLGGFAFDPVLATIFLAIGIGAIVQVIWEVGKLVLRDSRSLNLPAVNVYSFSGVAAGIAIMYFTAFLVKF
ncbi:MAG: metal transporter [Anaerolineae bacterium]